LNRNESGRFGALKSDSTHHFFRNACTKSKKVNTSFKNIWQTWGPALPTLLADLMIFFFFFSTAKYINTE
jgi:hypothetical protein